MRNNNFEFVESEDLSEKEFERQSRFPLLVCTTSDCPEPPYGGFEGDDGGVCVFCSEREPQTGRVLQARGFRKHKFYKYAS
jgi:hypothetical protein